MVEAMARNKGADKTEILRLRMAVSSFPRKDQRLGTGKRVGP